MCNKKEMAHMCFRPAGANKPIKCPKCGAWNKPTNNECQKCGLTAQEFAAYEAKEAAEKESKQANRYKTV